MPSVGRVFSRSAPVRRICAERSPGRSLVGQRHDVPSQPQTDPSGLVERELPAVSMLPRKSRKPGVGVPSLAQECVLVQLVDAGGADRIGAVDQPVAPLGLQQRTLPGRDRRRQREVVIRARAPRNTGTSTAEAVFAARGEHGHQQAGLALHRRVGRREDTANRRAACRRIRAAPARNRSSSRPRRG